MTMRFLGVACVLQASAALAHPGHGGTQAASWLHGLEAEHAVPALIAAAAAFALGAALRRRRTAARERRR